MTDSATQILQTDIKRLLEAARKDYDQKNWNNHSYFVSELNQLLKKAKDLSPELVFEEIKQAEKDEEIPTSWSSGMPYNPKMKESFASKSKKMIEVINFADKLFCEISSIVTSELSKRTKKHQSISLLKKAIDEIETLKKEKNHSNNFSKWIRDTEVAIEQIFPKGSRHLKDFKSVGYYPISVYIPGMGKTPSESEYQSAYTAGLKKVKLILQSMIDEIETYWEDEPTESIGGSLTKTTEETIELICHKFHTMVRQLRERYDDRETLDIKDEYDVQDLMHTLLRLFFEDIRQEEYSPSYAGGSSRVDFLIKKEKIVIEIKKTRAGLKAKQLGEQLIIDISRYKFHPDCKLLYCFVYDPEGYIKNPRGIENDLSKVHDGLNVKVFITPKDH